ncbi:hypothetical protein FACS1894170_08800 [Planctomycetales bacterium]|nr:hypothetical protein FACS1894170_08800 [Planctomycetales bacterium]
MIRPFWTIGLFVFGWVVLVQPCAADYEPQVEQRIQQYRKTMQDRCVGLPQHLQTKIKAQTERTIKTGLVKLRNGQLNMRIALPHRVAAQEHTRFLARHNPFNRSPFEIAGYANTLTAAVLTVAPVLKIAAQVCVPERTPSVLHLNSIRSEPIALSVSVVKTVVLRI